MIGLDLEWNSGYDKTRLEEILQIGAVRLDALGGKITDAFCAYVHPRVHKKLNRTAKALPELQASSDSRLDFPQALASFVNWCGDDTEFADWGGDDLTILRQNCAFWKVAAPKVTHHLNLQAAFSLKVGTNHSVALYRAVEYCGVPDAFTYHNAVNDAMYTALVSGWIDPATLALLALPKPVRRLADSPDFPPQPICLTGPYANRRSALSSRGSRRQTCPICGSHVWLHRWYPVGSDHYLSDFRCRDHGVFLCRLTLSPLENGQLQAAIAVPEITPDLLREFETACRAGAIACGGKSDQRKKRRRWHTPKKDKR
jgi:inhibitor of KinA sporulation pathway (predicted exonuclease)